MNVDQLYETIGAIEATPGLARFTFRATNQWLRAGHNHTTVRDFYGAGQEDTSRSKPFVLEADEPAVLLGEDNGANPVVYVLYALAACLTTSLVYPAASRGIKVEQVESRLEGDLDLRSFLGLSNNVRKGYENIRVTIGIKADAPKETLEELCKYSPVFSIISNPVPVSVRIEKREGSRRPPWPVRPGWSSHGDAVLKESRHPGSSHARRTVR